jgi:hypothetical protein
MGLAAVVGAESALRCHSCALCLALRREGEIGSIDDRSRVAMFVDARAGAQSLAARHQLTKTFRRRL